MMHSDSATAERAVQHLQKMIGVRAAASFPTEDGVARELALVKVRAPTSATASCSTWCSFTTPSWWMIHPTD